MRPVRLGSLEFADSVGKGWLHIPRVLVEGSARGHDLVRAVLYGMLAWTSVDAQLVGVGAKDLVAPRSMQLNSDLSTSR